MPLLRKEPSLYPEDLFTNGYAGDGRDWWVGRTLPRQEKAIARFLLRTQIHYYLPQYEKQWRSSGKRRRAWLPLFPGYVFIRVTGDDRSDALCSGHLAQTLEVTDQEELVRDLLHIRRAETSERVLEALTDWYAPGNEIVIRTGPLKGLEGTIEKRRGQTRMIVKVRFIGRAVAVELDPQDIEPR